MTNKEMMTVSKAISELHNACEYYDMVHDTGDNKQTEKNKNEVWKGYNLIIDLLHKNKLVK
tara:strand:+ start:473 stop:655 length:183 start_codon:yes stop_codon:yes gene_type:complete